MAKVEFEEKMIRVVPETYLEKKFFQDELKVNQGKVFVAVDRESGRYDDDVSIVIKPWYDKAGYDGRPPAPRPPPKAVDTFHERREPRYEERAP